MPTTRRGGLLAAIPPAVAQLLVNPALATFPGTNTYFLQYDARWTCGRAQGAEVDVLPCMTGGTARDGTKPG
jgi:hypothetical protein